MTEQLLIRLTPTLLERLETACRLRGLDKTETIRTVLIAEVQRLEAQITPQERELLDSLAKHNLSLEDVVASAVARKLSEEAQMRMPVVELAAAGGGR